MGRCIAAPGVLNIGSEDETRKLSKFLPFDSSLKAYLLSNFGKAAYDEMSQTGEHDEFVMLIHRDIRCDLAMYSRLLAPI
jgi:hypothetical protein